MLKIDQYTMTARVFPAAIVGSPIPLVIHTWFPFDVDGLAKLSVTTAVAVAVSFALSQAARELGKREEARLLGDWGAWPSTSILRHSDQTFDLLTKMRYHRRLVKLGAVERMPTSDEEAADPVAADKIYSSAAVWLRTKTRDTKKFPLIFSENINYGFRRNLLGCKALGVTIASTVCVGDLIALYFGRSSGVAGLESAFVLAFLLSFATSKSVSNVALDYAKRLIEAIDQLNTQKASAPRVRKKKAVDESVIV
ncbi:hypothetical protein [Rhodoblastus sp.]|jgi:hypothetical protein|uniref:hypothetical protein n=1 Tax=Rhodoblastus sp. TaxID=1962975 RepID=UPI0025DF96CF|nr:hypothetical protein [Rhodoblastus sp.]